MEAVDQSRQDQRSRPTICGESYVPDAAEAEISGGAVGSVTAAGVGAVAVAVAGMAKVTAAAHHAPITGLGSGGIFGG